jgi:hypothetical protein
MPLKSCTTILDSIGYDTIEIFPIWELGKFGKVAANGSASHSCLLPRPILEGEALILYYIE